MLLDFSLCRYFRGRSCGGLFVTVVTTALAQGMPAWKLETPHEINIREIMKKHLDAISRDLEGFCGLMISMTYHTELQYGHFTLSGVVHPNQFKVLVPAQWGCWVSDLY